jgi:hypothetical protein
MRGQPNGDGDDFHHLACRECGQKYREPFDYPIRCRCGRTLDARDRLVETDAPIRTRQELVEKIPAKFCQHRARRSPVYVSGETLGGGCQGSLAVYSCELLKVPVTLLSLSPVRAVRLRKLQTMAWTGVSCDRCLVNRADSAKMKLAAETKIGSKETRGCTSASAPDQGTASGTG